MTRGQGDKVTRGQGDKGTRDKGAKCNHPLMCNATMLFMKQIIIQKEREWSTAPQIRY